jgi:hypothetical protein
VIIYFNFIRLCVCLVFPDNGKKGIFFTARMYCNLTKTPYSAFLPLCQLFLLYLFWLFDIIWFLYIELQLVEWEKGIRMLYNGSKVWDFLKILTGKKVISAKFNGLCWNVEEAYEIMQTEACDKESMFCCEPIWRLSPPPDCIGGLRGSVFNANECYSKGAGFVPGYCLYFSFRQNRLRT